MTQRKATKVPHKRPHGDSTSAVGLKGSTVSGAELKVFKRLERREVLYPVKRAPHSRELSAAVTAIVEAKK
jgi:hypothetical protein